jgi:hypothetical protein
VVPLVFIGKLLKLHLFPTLSLKCQRLKATNIKVSSWRMDQVDSSLILLSTVVNSVCGLVTNNSLPETSSLMMLRLLFILDGTGDGPSKV